MTFIDPKHPFFIPLWRRVLTVAFAIGAASMELFAGGSPFFLVIFSALGLYAFWVLIVVWKPADEDGGPVRDEDK